MDLEDNNSTYSVNLDDIDIDFITNTVIHNAGPSRPFNKAENRGKDEFVEFELYASKIDDEENSNDELSSNSSQSADVCTAHPMYKCAICNIYIPITYRKEHNSSNYHKACVKIAEAVLQRLKNHVVFKESDETISKSSKRYFCGSCSVVIKNKDKDKHEASEKHKRSVLYERTLIEFYKVYTEQDYFDEDIDSQNLSPQHSPEVFKAINENQHPSVFRFEAEAGYVEPTSVSQSRNPGMIIIRRIKEQNRKKDSCDNTDDTSDENSSPNLFDGTYVYPTPKPRQIINADDVFATTPSISTFSKMNTILTEIKNRMTSNTSKDNFETQTTPKENNEQEYDEQTTSSKDQIEQTKDNVINQQTREENAESKYSYINEANSATNESNKTTGDDQDVEENIHKEENEGKKKGNAVLTEKELKGYLEWIKLLPKRKPMYSLRWVDQEFIEITTLDTCVVHIKADYFNGFFSNNGQMQCKVCLKEVEDASDHVYEVNHVKKIVNPLGDLHCTRKLDDTFHHCLHCNETFCSPDLHNVLGSHLCALQEAIARPKPPKPAESKDDPRTFCAPCNLYIDTHNLKSHNTGQRHIKNIALIIAQQRPSTSTDTRFCDKCTKDIPASTYTAHRNQHSNKEAETGAISNRREDGKIYCEPCTKFIYTENFLSHLNGRAHLVNFKSVNTTRVSNKDNFCDLCKLFTDDLSEHLLGEYHDFHIHVQTRRESVDKTQQKNNFKYHVEFTPGNMYSHCKVCTSSIPNSPYNIIQHTRGRAHFIKYKRLLDDNKMQKDRNGFFCRACKVTVALASDLDHIESASHIAARNDRPALEPDSTSNNYNCVACNVDIPNTSIQEHEDSLDHKIKLAVHKVAIGQNHSLHYYYTKLENKTKIKCTVCELEIPLEKAKMHLLSSAHNSQLRRILKGNMMYKSNNIFFCRACSVQIEKRQELTHIRLNTHTIALNSVQSTPVPSTSSLSKGKRYTCPVCQVQVVNLGRNKEIHEQGSSHKQKLGKLTPQEEEKVLFTATSNPRELLCTLCKVVVPVSGVGGHVKGNRHKETKAAAVNQATANP